MCLCLELMFRVIYSIICCECFRNRSETVTKRVKKKKSPSGGSKDKSKGQNLSFDSQIGKHRTVSEISEEEFRSKYVKVLTDKEPEDYLKENNYQIQRDLIGKGGYGSVYKAIRRLPNSGQQWVAVKVMNISSDSSQRDKKGMKREFYSLDIIRKNLRIKHDHIVTVFDSFLIEYLDQESGEMCTQAFIFMELADGNLADELISTGPMTNEKARRIFAQMVYAVDFLHKLGIAHRDIKLENFLVFSQKSSTNPSFAKIIKLTDFGLSAIHFKDDKGYIHTSKVGGSSYYKSPEILKNEVGLSSDKINNFKVDIWALGVCLYRLLTNTFPFLDFSDKINVIKRQQNKQFSYPNPNQINSKARDLIARLLEPNPNIRPYIYNSVRNHQWLEGEISLTLTKTN